jgi:hypothetical protein
LVQFQEGFLGPLVKEEYEGLLMKLRLLLERVLVQSLRELELLAEEGVDLPLLRLGFMPDQWGIEPLKGLKPLVGLKGSSLVKLTPLFEQGVSESLMRMRSLLERKMAQLLMDLHVENQGYPQDDSPVFLLRMPD